MALKLRARSFSPNLFRALRIDAEAQARTKGEIVGIDFDPFLGSQDPANRYEVRAVAQRGSVCSVEVWHLPTDPTMGATHPEVIADLTLVQGGWQFSNFRYPDIDSDLLTVLARLEADRRKK